MKPVGTSVYDALLLSLNRRARASLSLTGNWTISRCITDLINYEPGMAGFALSKRATLPTTAAAAAVATEACRQRNPVYQVRHSQRRAGRHHQHWQVASIVRAQSGDHFNVTTGVDSALTGQTTSDEPNPGDPYLKQGNQWLNPRLSGSRARDLRQRAINGFVGPARSTWTWHHAVVPHRL